MERYRPETTEELISLVQWAAKENEEGRRKAIEVAGHGSKSGFGCPIQADLQVCLAGFSGITLYEPDELVLSAGAGTPLEEIEAALDEHRQMLAFEPGHLGRLYGGGRGTIGGLLACNLAGSRRIRSGAARDHFLGFSAVTGRGEEVKSGGRVMKNVTGYDLSKLLAGSHGTLGAMTSVSIKVLPRPEKTRTVLVYGLDVDKAVEALSLALNAPCDVSGAAYYPAETAVKSAVGRICDPGTSVTLIRVEGTAVSVADRCSYLQVQLLDFGAQEELHSHNSLKAWKELCDLAWYDPVDGRALWRLSVAPTDAPQLTGTLARLTQGLYSADWGGGLLWGAVPTADEASAQELRSEVTRLGGHASLMVAPDALREAVGTFHPPSDGLLALSRRIKASFDPHDLLNPGRLYA